MPDLGSIALPTMYVLTAALAVALVVLSDGGVWYFSTVAPLATAAVLALPAAGYVLDSHELLMFAHFLGIILFVGGHSVSVTVALLLPREADGSRAAAYLNISVVSIYPMQAGLGLLITSGVALGFLEAWWDRLWIWLALDLLLAIAALMYVMAPKAYTVVRNRLREEGPAAWDADARALVDLRRAVVLMATGTGTLLVIMALMVVKPF